MNNNDLPLSPINPIPQSKGHSPKKSSSLSPSSLSQSPRRRKNRNSLISKRSLRPLLNRHQIVGTGVPKNEIETEIAHFASTLDAPTFAMEQKISQIPSERLLELMSYIMNKPIRNESDLIVIRYYLSKIPTLTTALSLKKNGTEPNEILHQLAVFIQGECFKKNRIICMNGEVGDKFYLVFKGKVSVLVPSPHFEDLTPIEYINHLYNLRRLREYDLLMRTIDSNRDRYMSMEILNLASEEYDCDNINKNEIISEYEYIERINPVKGIKALTNLNNESKEQDDLIIALLSPKKESDKKTENTDDEELAKTMRFSIWNYHKVCELGVGKSFGDIALSKDISNRTATIIASENSFLGSLHKGIYQICIKDAQEKKRKINLEYVLSQKLFKDFNSDIFERYYFNFFRSVRINRGDSLFKQGDSQEDIFFIFDGEIEVRTRVSLSFLNEIASSFNSKIKKNNRDMSERKIRNLNTMHPQMKKFYTNSHNFKIFIVKNKDVLGLEDNIYQDKYFTSATCVSDYCDYYAIEKKFFEKMIKNEYRVRENHKIILNEKIYLMIERLNKLKFNSIQNYYQTLVKLDNNYQNTENNDNNMANLSNRLNAKFYVNKLFKLESSPSIQLINNNNDSMQKSKICLTQRTSNNTEKKNKNYKTKVFKVQHKKSDTHLIITQNITPLTNWYIKKINTTKHCIINKIINNKQEKFINNSFTMSNIDCLAMDNFIKNLENNNNINNTNNNFCKTSRLKGSVYKLKKKKIFLKKLILDG